MCSKLTSETSLKRITLNFFILLGNTLLNSSIERTPTLSRDLNTSLTLANRPSRPGNFYTPPTARSYQPFNQPTSSSSAIPPPLPPRDVSSQQLASPAASGKLTVIGFAKVFIEKTQIGKSREFRKGISRPGKNREKCVLV